MLKLWLLKRYLKRLVASGGSICLWLSGGKDSRLLFEVLVEMGVPFYCLCFDEGWSREQKAVIDEMAAQHGVRIYSYNASWGSLIGNAEGDFALARGYAVSSNGETSVLIRDLVDAAYRPGRCIHDIKMPDARGTAPAIHFDLHILGTKKGESHWALGGDAFLTSKCWEIGDAEFAAPLYRWKDSDVILALRSYGIVWHEPAETQNTGNMAVCLNCLRTGGASVYCPKENTNIKPLDWSPTENLRAFQQSFGVGGK